MPRTNIHAIYDVDETLVHTYNDYLKYQGLQLSAGDILTLEKFNQQYRRQAYQINVLDCGLDAGTGVNHPMWGIKRPYLDEFLNFSHYFFEKDVLYSAGKQEYVSPVHDQIFRGISFRPQAVYNYDQIERVNGETRKPFSRLTEVIDPQRAFIIDDQLPAIKYNQGRGIHIPPFNPALTDLASEYKKDFYLLIIIKWFLDRPGINADRLELPTRDFLIKENQILINQPSQVQAIINRYDEFLLGSIKAKN